MVLKDDGYKVDGNMNESQSLKFGMDRILSEDVSSSAKKHPGRCSNGFQPPCAGCLSSLYRCCQLSNLSDSSHFNCGSEPFKTYTNALITATPEVNLNRGNEPNSNSSGDIVKRKRSWSRAVFSNLQRKGLEKRFQIQKYITKPDRRQLAATLGLTDAQVKVWFQNRRMKWRHSKELSRQNVAHHNESNQNVLEGADSSNIQITKSDCESDVDVQTIDN